MVAVERRLAVAYAEVVECCRTHPQSVCVSRAYAVAPLHCSPVHHHVRTHTHTCGFAGVDPKSILCEYFRHGQCTKGFKCKYSHDLAVERKTQKIDLVSDKCVLLSAFGAQQSSAER